MNSREFVAALKTVACDKASIGVLENIRNPPGRKPDPALVDLSKWFNNLPPDDKDLVLRVVHRATRQAVYNVLSVIDGLLAIEPEGKKTDLELVAKDGAGYEVLNDPAKEPLTQLFKET